MTIEVRCLLIRSVVADDEAPAREPVPAPPALEQLREQVLAECKSWLAEQLRQQQER